MKTTVDNRYPSEKLLPLLDRVKKIRNGNWIACCPVHGDKHPSLTITEKQDGRLLIHCHAQQCDVRAIVNAVGLELSDLFPPNPQAYIRSERRPFPADSILACIAHETLVVLIAADWITQGKSLSPDDLKRLETAAIRIREAYKVAGGVK